MILGGLVDVSGMLFDPLATSEVIFSSRRDTSGIFFRNRMASITNRIILDIWFEVRLSIDSNRLCQGPPRASPDGLDMESSEPVLEWSLIPTSLSGSLCSR